RVFGVCTNPNFHGHNYNLDVSVEGDIDPATGYVLDVNRLKEIVTECLVRHLDHKNLNLDVPWFRDLIPTAENIAVVSWRVLEPAVKPARLAHLRLWETERNYVDYDGT
ncbi:MAG: 6-carboxytetrahydropterin synthase, partial [Gemmatimonadales bacterium]